MLCCDKRFVHACPGGWTPRVGNHVVQRCPFQLRASSARLMSRVYESCIPASSVTNPLHCSSVRLAGDECSCIWPVQGSMLLLEPSLSQRLDYVSSSQLTFPVFTRHPNMLFTLECDA